MFLSGLEVAGLRLLHSLLVMATQKSFNPQNETIIEHYSGSTMNNGIIIVGLRARSSLMEYDAHTCSFCWHAEIKDPMFKDYFVSLTKIDKEKS